MHPGVNAKTHGDKIAYRMANSAEFVTYNTLDERSNQGAHLFRSLGLVPGDGIAILLPNHVQYLQITWAAQRSGLYYTPISILFQPSEINYILDNSDAKVLITTEQHLLDINFKALTDLQVFLIETPNKASPGTDFPNWSEAISAQPTDPIADECEGAEMFYSSGTTGVPKGVRFPMQKTSLGTTSTLFNTRVKLHQVSSETRYLSTAPLYHSAPLRYNMMVLRLGGTAVIMEKFDAQHALSLIQTHGITHSQWVPTMFVRLLKLDADIRNQYDVSSLRFAIHAAAPCPIDIKQDMIDWFGPILFEYYSGTEANGSTAITSSEWLAHKGSVGRAIHGELHILDDDGNEVKTGTVGSVFFANGSDFSYYKDEIKTLAAKNALGWSTLGDMGYVDDQGYLYLRDRKSFMIISGGVNIYPQEIENTLICHPKVFDVAVFGIPNAEFGEEVKAVIQPMPGVNTGNELANELIAFCRENISHVKCPRSVDFMDQLPRHPTGKLYKRKLRDAYWKGESKISI